MEGRSGQLRNAQIARDFNAFIPVRSGERIGWGAADPSDVFGWFCSLDAQAKGATVVHTLACPGVLVRAGKCVPGSRCPKRYVSEELGRGAPWNPIDRFGNPRAPPVVEMYLTGVAEEQKRGGTP